MKNINRDILVDIGLRILSCVCVGYFVISAFVVFGHDKSRYSVALAGFSEVATIVVSLFSRRPAGRDWGLWSVAAVVYSAGIWAVLVKFDPHIDLIGQTTAIALQVFGMLWAMNAKITLGRSFGWLPANRGIVDTGVYRLVRHPIYLGYLIGHIGLLAANFNLQNLIALALLYTGQIYRIFQEEKFLMVDEAYRNYAKRVPYRLIYGVF